MMKAHSNRDPKGSKIDLRPRQSKSAELNRGSDHPTVLPPLGQGKNAGTCSAGTEKVGLRMVP